MSVIVPTHFRQGMLSNLLSTIKDLVYPKDKLELIVVGAEEDDSRHAVESFAQAVSFRVVYQIVGEEALRSVAFKRNIGARVATGDVLAFVDDDCVPHPRWVAAASQLFRTPTVGGVEGRILVPKPERPTLTYRGSLRLQEPGGYRTGNIFYRRSVFEECGGFDESLPYLEDVDLGLTVIERGYNLPFASDAVVDHPVQPARPLVPLILARTARDLPYLFEKHAQSRASLRHNVRLFNRAHYPYLVLYVIAAAVAGLKPVTGALTLAIGLCVLIPVHLVYNYWGLRFTANEIALTALSHPLVPVARLLWWLVGSVEHLFGIGRTGKRASR